MSFLLMYGHTARVALIGLIIVLNILDLLTTYLDIKTGKGKEGNYLAALALKKGGWYTMLGIKLVVIFGLIKWGVYYPNTILAAVAVFYLAIVSHNYYLYRK